MLNPHKYIKNESFLAIKSGPSFCNDSLYVLLHNNVLKCLIYSISIDIVLPKIRHFLPSIANTEELKDYFFFVWCFYQIFNLTL